MKKVVMFLLGFLFTMNLMAQDNQMWDGKKCAVVLTYDDGLNVHLDNAIPLLDSLGLKGTFYIPGNSQPFADRLDEWRDAADNGHELGNHTLYHPCDGNMPGREWVSKAHDLSNYSIQQIVDEVRLCNTFLKAVDGKTERTFAYTCGDRKVEGELFYDKVKNDFLAARGVYSAMNDLSSPDLSNINCYSINGKSGAELISLVKEAMKDGKLLVFLFHGVGGDHKLNVSLPAHRALVRFIKENEGEIWSGTLADAARQIRGK